ncbi:MAG: PqqD family protein [Acidobacteriota bacterium]
MRSMNKPSRRSLPRSRRKGLAVQELSDEVLVYDLERHRAHGLNPLAAVIWKNCDGKHTLDELARRVERELGIAVDRELVRIVLARLARARLLEKGSAARAVYSRREFAKKLKKLGLAASVMLPMVTSIVSPTPSHAVSCVPHNGCGGVSDCTPCANPGGNCNSNWRCCGGQCVTPGHAKSQCGC